MPLGQGHVVCHRQLACLSVYQAAEAGIEPASERVTTACPYQHEHHRINHSVRMAGFEPAISCFRRTRDAQASPHPESQEHPVGVEPTRPPWRGDRLPLHHGRLIDCRVVKDRRAPGGNRTLVAALRVRCRAAGPPVFVQYSSSVGPVGIEPTSPGLRDRCITLSATIPMFRSSSRATRSRTRAPTRSVGRLLLPRQACSQLHLCPIVSSSYGNRTHLSALKGRYPLPIDERAVLCAYVERKVGGEALESSSAVFQTAARPSQLPAQAFVVGIQKKARCLLVTPGLGESLRELTRVTSAEDAQGTYSPADRRNDLGNFVLS